jgi:RimJ/RimL family protein N-acetyltransferase
MLPAQKGKKGEKLTRNTVKISKIETADEKLDSLPRGLSAFFEPFLRHEVGEAIEADGEVYISEDGEGQKNGLFIYDNYEETGTVFTKSRDVFDHFCKVKPSSYIFSELEATDLPKEIWNIWQLDVDRAPLEHRFKHTVSMNHDANEIEQFMATSQPETNKKWVRVALKHGDRCFVVKISGRIVGMAWMSIVGGVARSHGLYVEPQYRRMGIMKDNLHARLIYLKSRHVHTLINEIAEYNTASASHAASIGEKIVGKMFLYTSPPA